MNRCASIISSNFCIEMFHQSGMFQYLFKSQQKLEKTPNRVQFTHNTLRQNGGCHRMKGYEVRGRGSGGWGGGVRAVFPDVAAVARLPAVLKITAFTLHLKNSSSDHLFSRKSSSSIVFPRPLQLLHHRLALLVSLASFQSAACGILSVFGLYHSLSHSLRNLLPVFHSSASQPIQTSKCSQTNSNLGC